MQSFTASKKAGWRAAGTAARAAVLGSSSVRSAASATASTSAGSGLPVWAPPMGAAAAVVDACVDVVPGGAAILLKGSRAEDEIVRAESLIDALGGAVVHTVRHRSGTAGRTTVVASHIDGNRGP